jgi:hypothetical protein
MVSGGDLKEKKERKVWGSSEKGKRLWDGGGRL